MNIAVLIGVSDYDSQENLPGCKNDVEIIKEIIDLSGKYEKKLIISENTYSSEVKQIMSNFFNELISKGTEVDEVLFYYSGHGLYENDEFYYIFSDYTDSKLNRTTYKNSEIDEMLKSLNPKLTVKIIDACESGIRYVKDIDNFEVKKMFKETQNKFENCYFMYSSHSTEVSYASKDLSYFTTSLVKSIIEHNSDFIRYRDVMDYIADEFKEKSIEQTPYYVTQGNNTEVFTKVDDNIKNILKTFLQKYSIIEGEEEKNRAVMSLLDKIKMSAKDYCTDYEEVVKVFGTIEETVTNNILRTELKDIFEKEENFPNQYYGEIPNIQMVAEALADRKDELFIRINYGVKTVKVPITNRFAIAIGEDKDRIQFKEEKRKFIESYDITEQETPYTTVELDLTPKFPNVNKYNCTFLFAYSKVNLIIIYSYNKYKEVTWGEYELEKVKWRKLNDIILKDELSIKSVVDKIIESFYEYVINDLNKQFGIEPKNPLLELANSLDTNIELAKEVVMKEVEV